MESNFFSRRSNNFNTCIFLGTDEIQQPLWTSLYCVGAVMSVAPVSTIVTSVTRGAGDQFSNYSTIGVTDHCWNKCQVTSPSRGAAALAGPLVLEG